MSWHCVQHNSFGVAHNNDSIHDSIVNTPFDSLLLLPIGSNLLRIIPFNHGGLGGIGPRCMVCRADELPPCVHSCRGGTCESDILVSGSGERPSCRESNASRLRSCLRTVLLGGSCARPSWRDHQRTNIDAWRAHQIQRRTPLTLPSYGSQGPDPIAVIRRPANRRLQAAGILDGVS